MASFADRLIALDGISAGVPADARGRGVWSPSAGVAWRATSSLSGSISGLVLAIKYDATAPRLTSDVPCAAGAADP